MTSFDVLVVGGGHAGCEAAAVAARMGARTALVSFDLGAIGAMSCNPAIGGLGKGHLVREVDAFDGLLARAADNAAIHYRMLNRSKGSAVWGPRVQADRQLFKWAVQEMIQAQDGLELIEGEAAALVIERGRVCGIDLASGERIHAGAVILCTGTFLGGTLFRGEERLVGGRVGEAAAHKLALQLREAALTRGRLNRRLSCAIARPTAQTPTCVRECLHRSPLFTGAIGAAGPRYCPSIEDKTHRFGDRDGPQILLEPEGLSTRWVYPNGV